MNLVECERMLNAILDEISSALTSSERIEDALAALDRYQPPLAAQIGETVTSATAAKAVTLKLLNHFLARFQFQRRATALVARPFGLVVDPTNACNLACPGCVHSERPKANRIFDWNPGTLPEDRFVALARRQAPFAVQTVFCNYGEPTLNPRTPEMIREAKGYFCQTMLSTNMTAPRFDAEAYAACGLDYMIVSIDGATQPVYELFRRKGKLDVALNNIRALVEAKRKAGRTAPIVCWRFLAFEHNVHEVSLAREISRELGCDEFQAAVPWQVAWDEPGIQPAPFEPFADLWTDSIGGACGANFLPAAPEFRAREIGEEFQMRWIDRLDPAFASDANGPESRSEHACHWLYKNMVVDGNGRVFPCCGAPAPGVDIVFADASAADPFNSPKYRQARKFFATGDRQPVDEAHCVRCEWNQEKATIDTAHVRTYLLSALGGAIGSETLDRVCLW